MPRTQLQTNAREHTTPRDGLAPGTTVRRVPRQERSKLLVDCIRIAASEILEKDGPTALTTNNIAARAGVSIGSLYQYFANKEEILEEVFREHADRSFEDSRQWADWVRTLPLRDVIRLIVERAIRRHREFLSYHPDFYGRHHDELQVGLRVMEGANGAAGEPYAVAWLREVFEIRRDELRVPDPRLAAVALAHGVSAMLHGLVETEQSLLYDDSLMENLAEMVCGFLLYDEPEEVRPRRRQTG
jgi:AcrR family transcriptional regulator